MGEPIQDSELLNATANIEGFAKAIDDSDNEIVNESTNKLKQKTGQGVKLAKGISIAQFFEANRQMLGFSSLSRNLLITVKEATDNALDAAEDQKILVHIDIVLTLLEKQTFKVSISDNGPGIPRAKIGSVFGRLLYGSKFHEKRQKRGQQGLGISACLLNSQIDLNKPGTVISKLSQQNFAHYQDIKMDILKNDAIISNYKKIKVDYEHGTSIELQVKGKYISEGRRSILFYLQQVSFMNPWANITFTDPSGKLFEFKRTSDIIELPEVAKIYPKSIAYGVFCRHVLEYELDLETFLHVEIEGINETIVKEVLFLTGIPGEVLTKALNDFELTLIFTGLQNFEYPVNNNTIAVVGQQQLLTSLDYKNYTFCASITTPIVAIGNTVARLELALVYGGSLLKDEKIELYRFVNKVPLLLQPGSCLLNNAITKVNWRNYGLDQTKNELPIGPIKLIIHLAGYQIPFNSEAKESVSEIPGLEKQYIKSLKKLGLILNKKLSKQQFIAAQKEKLKAMLIHLPALYIALNQLTQVKQVNQAMILSKIMNGLIYAKTQQGYIFANYTSVDYTLTYESKKVVINNNTTCHIETFEKFYTQLYCYEINYDTLSWVEEITPYYSLIQTLYTRDEPMLDKLLLIVKDLVLQLESGAIPDIVVRTRNKENLVLNEQGYWTLGSRLSHRAGKKTNGMVHIIRVVKLISLFKVQLLKDNTSSLREVYYVSETWGQYYKFNEQPESDGAIEFLELVTGASRQYLGVFPEARGQIAGPLVISQKIKAGKKLINCITDLPDRGGGILIPFSATQIQIIEDKSDFTLAIETSGAFNRLVENQFHIKYNCNLVCTNGQPTRSTREVLKLLAKKPVLAFFDCDNWSLRIFGSCSYGSIKTAHLSHKLCIPSLIHLGLTYDDIIKYGLPTDRLKKIDLEGFKQLLEDPRYAPEIWHDVLMRQYESKVKAEQQSLAALGLDFVTQHYLPEKLKTLGII